MFARSEPSEDDTLLTDLRNLSDALGPHNSHWADVLHHLRSEIAGCKSVVQRYEVAREIESVFGGRGVLTTQMPADCERRKEELFSAVQCVLRACWRALGRESHAGRVRLLPVGASVRLVPGAVRYFNGHRILARCRPKKLSGDYRW